MLIQVVRLLGGRQRTKPWSATIGGQFDGVWGEHLITEHLRRAVRRLARILYIYYGGVFRMETGLQRGSDPEEAFSRSPRSSRAGPTTSRRSRPSSRS